MATEARADWDGNNLAAETDSSGNVKANYVYDKGGNPVSMVRNRKTYFYQTNSHGDIVSLTNSAGQIVATYSYDPWGKLLSSTGTIENPLRYAGYFYDTETGLYYLMARYYDPALTRFITREELDLTKTADPMKLHPYLYCCDNPVASTDRNGEDSMGFVSTGKPAMAGIFNCAQRLRAQVEIQRQRTREEEEKDRRQKEARDRYVNYGRYQEEQYEYLVWQSIGFTTRLSGTAAGLFVIAFSGFSPQVIELGITIITLSWIIADQVESP